MKIDADELKKWAELCSKHQSTKLTDSEKRFWIAIEEPSMVRSHSVILYDELDISLYARMGFRIIEVNGSHVVQPGTCEEFYEYLEEIEDTEDENLDNE